MTRPAEVVAGVRRALRPGGRFVAEMGGAGNVATILAAVGAALEEVGLRDGMRVPWYFPTAGEYSTVLEQHGFQVRLLQHFPRPTPLRGTVADWVRMFGDPLVAHVPSSVLPGVLSRVDDLCRDRLAHGGAWSADYVRLRFEAVLP